MSDYDNIEIIESMSDLVDGEVRYNYSGRNMYGKSCMGIVFDGNETDFFISCIKSEDEEILDFLRKNYLQFDSMGRNTIVYFPSVESIKEDEDCDNE